MAKFFPVIGEIWTLAESTVKGVGAGIAYLAGDEESAKQLKEGAEKAWIDYSENNVIAAPVRSLIHSIDGDKDEALRVIKSLGTSFEGVVDNTPAVGHVKGIIHYAAGDIKKGDQCMKGASRSAVVLTATVLTGGAAAPVYGVAATAVAAGSASVVSGAGMDAITTAIDSHVHDEYRPAGYIAAIDQCVETGDKSALVDAILMPVGEFASGAMQGVAIKKAHKLNQIKKNREPIRKAIGKENTKKVVDTARKLEKTIEKYEIKGDKHVMTKVIDNETGKEFTGVNRRARGQIREIKNPSEVSKLGQNDLSSIQKKTDPSNLPKRLKGQRAHRSCAEHHAFDKYFDAFPEKQDGKSTTIISVQKNGD